MLFKCWLFFLFCCFGCVVAAERFLEASAEESAPPPKKIKIEIWEGPRRDILKILMAAGDAGCSSDEIKAFLPKSRCGRLAVLENVVSIMFAKYVVITHNADESRFWYKGPAIKDPNAPDIRLALARQFIHRLPHKSIHLSDVADRLLQQGCYVENYHTFTRLYNAVSVICRQGTTEVQIRVQHFLDFVQTVQKGAPQSFDRLVLLYATRHKPLGIRERLIASYVFGLPKKIYEEIEQMRQNKERVCLSHLFVGSPLWQKAQCHMAISVAEIVRGGATSFTKVYGIVSQKRPCIDAQECKKAYNAVNVICFKNKSILKDQILRFLDYGQKNPWPKNVTFLDIKAAYCKEERGPFDIQLWETAEYILSMPQSVLQHLQWIKASLLCSKQNVKQSELFKEMERCAREGATHSSASLSQFIVKNMSGPLEVLRYALNIAFSSNIDIFYDEQGLFRFSFFNEEKIENIVPIEVLVAGRFCGVRCNPKDKVYFANTLRRIGCSLESYDAYSDMFDAVCLAGGVFVAGIPHITRANRFFLYLKQDQSQRSLQELMQIHGYSLERKIDARDVSIVMHALRIDKTGVLASWGLTQNMQRDAGCGDAALDKMIAQYQKSLDSLTIRVLEEYAEKGIPCSCKIFQIFLPHCTMKDVARFVLNVALARKARITYDEEKGTISLHEEPYIWPTPPGPIKAFILEKIFQDPRLDSVNLSYDLCGAGYPLASCQEAEDLREIYTQLAHKGAKNMLLSIKGYIFYSLRNLRGAIVPMKKRCFAGREANFPINVKHQMFGASLLRLYESKRMDMEDINRLFSDLENDDHPMSWDICGLVGDVKERVDKNTSTDEEKRQQASEETHTDVDVSVKTQASGRIALAPEEGTPQPQADLDKVGGRDFLTLVQGAAQAKEILGYKDIFPYATGVTTPQEVLEFVMDFVFQAGMKVRYNSAQEEYKFSLKKRREQKRSREEALMRYVKAQYAGKKCTKKDRAKCAYAMHLQGSCYGSFSDFGKDFCAVCMVQGIAVEDMEDVSRGKMLWHEVLTGLAETTDICFQNFRECHGLRECSQDAIDLKDVFERAMAINMDQACYSE